MSKQVLCFGEILWDTFTDGKVPGGAPLNVARHLLQQGIPALIVSCLGSDDAGNKMMTFLSEHNVPLELVQQSRTLSTCEVTVNLDEGQQATYTIPEPVSWDDIKLNDELINEAKQAAAIVFGSLASRGASTRNSLLDILDNGNIPLRIFDVNLRAPHYTKDAIETLAAKANVVKMNEEEARLLIGGSNASLQDQILEFHSKFQTQTICVTRGENGAMIWQDGNFYEHPGFKVNVIDTVGAGDAFLATLIAGLLNEQPIEQTLEHACRVGAEVAGRRGASPL